MRGALVAGIGLAILQQFVGPNTVLFYGPTIFGYAGISAGSGGLGAEMLVGAVLFVCVLPTIVLVDAVGRKKLFYFGLTGMGSMLVLLGLAFHFGASSWGLGVLVILLVYIGCYSLSISPLFWLMTAELFPNRLRGYGASSATVANWSANLLITLTFLSAVDALGKDVVFWIYAAVRRSRNRVRALLHPGDQGPCAGGHRRVLDRGPRMARARPRDLLDDTVSAASQQIIQEIRASNSPDGASG